MLLQRYRLLQQTAAWIMLVLLCGIQTVKCLHEHIPVQHAADNRYHAQAVIFNHVYVVHCSICEYQLWQDADVQQEQPVLTSAQHIIVPDKEKPLYFPSFSFSYYFHRGPPALACC